MALTYQTAVAYRSSYTYRGLTPSPTEPSDDLEADILSVERPTIDGVHLGHEIVGSSLIGTIARAEGPD